MWYTIVALDAKENFISFIDPDRCEVKETHKTGGLRTLNLEYKFHNLQKDKELFRFGNKIWIRGDVNLTDCLYVVNTNIEEDIFKENSFTVELEEVLVELNNTPLFFQTELTTDNGFKTKTSNGQSVVKVDYNALNYWFGDYFNMGVVQDCLSDNMSWITVTGSITRMSLLRQIEEETSNTFVTRYEKDPLNNTIHRYLDFLNPINANKNWTLNLEYDFQGTATLIPVYDEDGNPTTPDKPWEVRRFIDDVPAESVTPEDTDWYEEGTEDPNWTYNEKDETVVDENTVVDYTPITNLNPANTNIRITDGENLLNSQGEIYNPNDETQTPLQWTSTDIGFDTSITHAVISLCMMKRTIGLTVNDKTLLYPLPDDPTPTEDSNIIGLQQKGYVDYTIDTEEGIYTYTDSIYDQITNDNKIADTLLPDDCYLELYDTIVQIPIFQTQINRQIGHVHEEILDLTHNITNVEMKIDESDVYTGVSPIFNQNNFTREDMNTLINNWINFNLIEGTTAPMILEKTYVQCATVSQIANVIGAYDQCNNFWVRPINPQDQLDTSNSANNKWEVWRARAYWKAPFTKHRGDSYLLSNSTQKGVDYTEIIGRNDTRNEQGPVITPKIGTSTTSDDVHFAIYNQLALYLKEHMAPDIELTVDVANLKDHEYNNYEIHDKVYIKIPDYEGLITATVNETSKEPNNISKNTIKLTNYSVNNGRIIPNETIINAENKSFKFPDTELLTVSLENRNYDETDTYSVQYPSNKLISFSVFKVENNNATWTGETFTKTTDENGEATIIMDYDPGDYEINIDFGGDEEYLESHMTIKVNVGGTKAESTSTDSSGTVKTTTYYDKYGRSPDKSKILAIGRISAGRDTGSYANFYETEFQNRCPHCGKQTLFWGIFWAGNEHSNWGKFPATGRSEGGSAEGHLFCSNCDADYSCQGHEHVNNGKKLTVTKKTTLSSKTKAYELRNGKRVYATTVVTQGTKNVTNSTERKVVGSVDSYVKKQALNIVGNKTGQAAAQAIASWMDKNIDYWGYINFVYSAKKCLQMKKCNCCDGTRLYFELCDAAGLTEYYKMEYIHVYGHVYGRMTTKSTGKYVHVDNASTHAAWGYICMDYRNRGIIHKTVYPKLPF